MSSKPREWLTAEESGSATMCNLGLASSTVIALASLGLIGVSKADAEVVSAVFMAPADWWPSSETTWNILATLLTALIAAGAAIFAAKWAAKSTMESARNLQDRERRLDEKSVAVLLSAELHRKLFLLVHLLPKPEEFKVDVLATMDTNTKVLEATLPKLGTLGSKRASDLLAIFEVIELLVFLARGQQEKQSLTEQMRTAALRIGRVNHSLWEFYELDMPPPLEKLEVNLEELGLKELKDLGF